jgi:hypothetical protein
VLLCLLLTQQQLGICDQKSSPEQVTVIVVLPCGMYPLTPLHQLQHAAPAAMLVLYTPPSGPVSLLKTAINSFSALYEHVLSSGCSGACTGSILHPSSTLQTVQWCLLRLQIQPTTFVDPAQHFQLLQLPGPALSLVLQQLDQCSLASTAVTCSTLRHAAAAASSKVDVKVHTGSSEAKLDSLIKCLDVHSSSWNNLEQCSVSQREWTHVSICSLPCRHLRQLHLDHVAVQLGPGNGHPGVLQHCTGLTALSLESCEERDVAAAAAAIATLPQLQSLRLVAMASGQHKQLLAQLNSAAVLRQLMCLEVWAFSWSDLTPEEAAVLSQLSGFVSLQHLGLCMLPGDGEPGGLPSQLVKLTHLSVGYEQRCDTAGQFQHLSCLTELQQLSVQIRTWNEAVSLSGLSGIQHLSNLTHLGLISQGLDFCTNVTQAWTQLTALQSLTLAQCQVQPEVLAQMTQLQALDVGDLGGASLPDLLGAVSQLSALTMLRWTLQLVPDLGAPAPAAAAAVASLTALTASTNLCSLQLAISGRSPDQGLVLFLQNMTYPKLQSINLWYVGWCLPLREQQLQQLCACCPAVEDLKFVACQSPSAMAYQPLTQLSALTRLAVYRVGEAVGAVMDAAARLTGLRGLRLEGLPQVTHSALLQLTALTALEEITLTTRNRGFLHKLRSSGVQPLAVAPQFVAVNKASVSQQPVDTGCPPVHSFL